MMHMATGVKQTGTIFSGKQKLPETIVYIVLWAFMLILPVASQTLNYLSGIVSSVDWGNIAKQWLATLPYIVLFVVHNRILVPHLFTRKRVCWYILATLLVSAAVLLTVSVLMAKYQNIRPMTREDGPEYAPDFDGMNLPPFDREAPPADFDMRQGPPPSVHGERREPRDDDIGFMFFFPVNDPLGIHGPLLGRIIVVLLLYCFNIAVKLFYRSIRDQQSIQEMERSKLQTELDYLKSQLNPHFFMNTLNNIHALVDIDTEKAKDTIIELSGLMRYVLYEAAKPSIQLSREIEFLGHYIHLMRIRYTDKLQVNTSLPTETSGICVPPLLFVSFIENAFKHGVSYREASFINVSMQVHEGEVTFLCSNSTHHETYQDDHHGIGFDNIRKRLDLLYGNDYSLNAKVSDGRYDVSLTFPFSSEPRLLKT